MKILITGFNPFGGETVNPAYEAVKLLPDTIAGAQIVKQEIPTEFGRAGEVLEAAMNEHKPDVVICIGQAGGRSAITPEKVGINIMEGRIPDNAGYQPVDVTIREDGETAYFTSLPVKAMVQKMKDAGIPAALSYTAGSYVCNYLLYTLLYLSIIFCEQSPERTYQRIFPVDGRLRKSENEDKISIRCHASVPFPEIWVRQWTRLACGHCLSHLSAAANLSYPAGSSDKRRPQFLRSAYPQMGAAAAHLQGHASRCNSNAANRLRFLNSVHSCYPAPLQADAFPDNGFGSVKRPFPVPDG